MAGKVDLRPTVTKDWRICPLPGAQRRELGRADLPFEFMMNALRLAEGFPVAMFAERTGMPITAAERALAQAEARGLVERDHARIRPTALGRRYLNDLLELFLPEREREKT